jgi:ankyrin repeat protein
MSACVLLASGSDARLADAAEQRDWAALKALLEKGADVNAAQVDGTTALHWATYNDSATTVELLLRSGADVEATNRYGVTPLSLACVNGDQAVVESLLEAGTDPNSSLPGGETALMTASRTGKIGAVKALLARGAEVDAAESHDQTALMWAAAEGHVDVVELLIEFGADFRKRLDSGFTPLLFAVREGRIEVVRALLQAGADPNEFIDPQKPSRRPRPGTSALLLAAENAHFEVGALLLEAGADPDADRTGYTVLHAIPVVRNPGVGDNDPPPPGSGEMTSIEFVKQLVEHGAALNARMTTKVNLGNTRLNKIAATPFFVAAQSADAELLRTLAELGADTTLTNEENSTPLMAATGIGTRSPGEDAGTEEEVLEAVEALLELGADINAVDDRGETAMHGASYKNLPKVIAFLAENGAEIAVWSRENAQGWTPLTIAYGYRFGNFKPSPPTVEALQRAMLAAGVTPPDAPTRADGISDYAR